MHGTNSEHQHFQRTCEVFVFYTIDSMFRHLQLCRVCRDDGAPSTLLRVRPTNSISADAFVLPFVYVSDADRVIFLETLQGIDQNSHA